MNGSSIYSNSITTTMSWGAAAVHEPSSPPLPPPGTHAKQRRTHYPPSPHMATHTPAISTMISIHLITGILTLLMTFSGSNNNFINIKRITTRNYIGVMSELQVSLREEEWARYFPPLPSPDRQQQHQQQRALVGGYKLPGLCLHQGYHVSSGIIIISTRPGATHGSQYPQKSGTRYLHQQQQQRRPPRIGSPYFRTRTHLRYQGTDTGAAAAAVPVTVAN